MLRRARIHHSIHPSSCLHPNHLATPRASPAASKYSATDRPIPRYPLRPIFYSSTRAHSMATSAAPQARFSQGTDPAAAAIALAALTTGPEGKWTLGANGDALERTIRFKTFKAAWAFMDTTAAACKRAKHHPEWSNVYNTVFVRWTTHNPAGLSSKDLDMARACDEAAAQEGEIAAATGETDGNTVARGLADRVAGVAGDCCVPGSKGAGARQEDKARV